MLCALCNISDADRWASDFHFFAVCREMSIAMFAGNVVPYQFPVLEMGLFILVLFGMELILSVWTIRRQKKQSLIEQMRAME